MQRAARRSGVLGRAEQGVGRAEQGVGRAEHVEHGQERQEPMSQGAREHGVEVGRRGIYARALELESASRPLVSFFPSL